MNTRNQQVFPWAEEGLTLTTEPMPYPEGLSYDDQLAESLRLAMIEGNGQKLLSLIKDIVEDQVEEVEGQVEVENKRFYSRTEIPITPRIQTKFYTAGEDQPLASDYESASEFFSRLARGWTITEALNQEDHK